MHRKNNKGNEVNDRRRERGLGACLFQVWYVMSKVRSVSFRVHLWATLPCLPFYWYPLVAAREKSILEKRQGDLPHSWIFPGVSVFDGYRRPGISGAQQGFHTVAWEDANSASAGSSANKPHVDNMIDDQNVILKSDKNATLAHHVLRMSRTNACCALF